MKREEVLFYLTTGKIYLYLKNTKREIIEDIDTSTFFKYGEISSVEDFTNTINDFMNKKKIFTGIFKSNIYVLYNNITNCDLTFLYKSALNSMGFNNIEFISITKVLKTIGSFKRLVLCDEDYFTLIDKKEKVLNLNDITFEPILIGGNMGNFTHYADTDLIWNSFKSHFTNN